MKLYVGTYAKYNRGSIAGKWLDLDKFKNGEEFLAACRKLHKDERDPELMFQDVETDPGADWQEGLYSESSIPWDYWKLKAEAEAEAARDADKPSAKAEKAEQARLLERFMAVTGWGEDMRKYFKNKFYYITLSGGEIYHIERPSIQTRFCCGEDERGQGGEEYGTMAYARKELAAKRTEKGFFAANLNEFDHGWIVKYGREATKRRQRCEYNHINPYLRPTYSSQKGNSGVLSYDSIIRGTYYYFHTDEFKLPDGARSINAEDMRLIRAGYAKVRRDFRKRLSTWWKRFGASKIRTWTYWTEA